MGRSAQIPPEDEGGSGQTTTQHSGPHALPPEAQAALPVIHVEMGTDPNAELQLEETLGEGGMGRVLSARQKALQRSVAVKFPKSTAADVTGLIREAIVMGRLEHPSIVPVHALARTTEGLPFFTMKRVEGTPWSEAIERGGSLVEHLEVLLRVCDAVAFAHSRGVIHRDIKPSNVLLGAYGEVYLVDWGLAASLEPDTVLPHVRQLGMGGTPGYLAPEMVTGGDGLGTWSDVFLLGATLYHVLEGRPPYDADSAPEAIALAAKALPAELNASLPGELAAICRKAMQPDVKQRFESAQAFKAALTSYLRHREVLELNAAAMERLAELERAVGASGDKQRSVHGMSLQPLYTECRFNFAQVRRLWPELAAAREGQYRATTLMVQHELLRGSPRAARLMLAELEDPPAPLIALLEAAERKEAAAATHAAELEVQAKERSPDAAIRGRALYASSIGVLIVLASALIQALVQTGVIRFTTPMGVPFAVVLLANSGVYVAWVYRDPEANTLQRQVSIALLGLNGFSLAGWILAWYSGLELALAASAYFLMNAACWWVGAIVLEPRGMRLVVGFGAAALLSAVFPAWAPLSGACVGVGFLLLARKLSTAR
jgi:eukaryotic-like serine/threonine-protein kinase